MSALATIVGSLGELSESELRQLYLMVGVRLGIPDVPTGSKTQGKAGSKTSNAKKSSGAKSKQNSNSSSKGNPQRKSQWANHPLYQEYSRLKKVVEAQAKDGKTSFNSIDTAESRAYKMVFNQWLEAKSSFRGHGESGQDRVKPGEKEIDSEDESEGEEAAAAVPASKTPSPPRAAPPPAQRTVVSPPAKPMAQNGKSVAAPTKGKAPAK